MTDILDELHWRGLVVQSTDEAALRQTLSEGPITYYCGFDPTGPSLHVGHLVQILTLRRLQLAGHLPVALVGGATGLIGDPKPTAERVLRDKATVAGWVERIRDQLTPFLDFSGPHAARLVNNLDWIAELSALDFLRDLGKHFRVNRMLTKEAVSARLESEQGISFTEFSYQILQAYDFLQLYRRFNCLLQTGGSDQWGNLTAGVDLIHRVEGKAVHAIATPLVTKADGTKFGKSEEGAVWLDPELTSPYAFYQFWVNTDDRDVSTLLRLFSFAEREQIEALEKATAERPAAREAQRALATELTTLVHGAEECAKAQAAAAALFGRGALGELDERTLRAALQEAGLARLPMEGKPSSYVDLLVAAGLAASRSAARRTIVEGGAYVNNIKVSDADGSLSPADLLYGRFVVVRRGKRNVAGIEVEP